MNKLFKSICIFVLVIIFIIPLSGCSQSIELGDSLIVEGIAVDRGDDGRYIVTIQVFDASNSSSDDTSTVDVIYSEGSLVSEAFGNASLQTGKTLLYSQNTILVIGEKTATNTNLYDFMDFFVRHYQARPDVYVFVAKGLGSDILSVKKDDKYVPASNILSLGKSGDIKASSTVKQVVSDIKNDTSNPLITTIAIANVSDEPIIYEYGVAVFNNENKLAGFLQTDDALGLSFIRGEGSGENIYVSIAEDVNATVNINKLKSDIDFESIDGKPTYTISINCTLSLYELDSVDLRTRGIDYEDIEAASETKIKDMCESAIYSTVETYHSDVCNFGKVLLQDDTEYYKDIVNDFNNNLNNMNFDVEVNAKIDILGQEAS